MKAFRSSLVIGFVVMLSEISYGQELWSIGPMLHINLGEKRTTSFSIEAAYWNLERFFYSFDFAIEFDRGKVRLYTEAQTGIGLTGVSLGPVIEFQSKGGGTHLGVQGSCWINYFVGADYRVRFIDHKRFDAIGVYAKIPFAMKGFEESGGGSVNWGDWDSDWD